MIENYTRFLIYDMKFTLIKIKQQKIEVVLKPPPLSVFTAFNESFVNLFLKTTENNTAWIVAWIYVGPKKSPLQKRCCVA